LCLTVGDLEFGDSVPEELSVGPPIGAVEPAESPGAGDGNQVGDPGEGSGPQGVFDGVDSWVVMLVAVRQ
jgi:hypothetical protein